MSFLSRGRGASSAARGAPLTRGVPLARGAPLTRGRNLKGEQVTQEEIERMVAEAEAERIAEAERMAGAERMAQAERMAEVERIAVEAEERAAAEAVEGVKMRIKEKEKKQEEKKRRQRERQYIKEAEAMQRIEDGEAMRRKLEETRRQIETGQEMQHDMGNQGNEELTPLQLGVVPDHDTIFDTPLSNIHLPGAPVRPDILEKSKRIDELNKSMRMGGARKKKKYTKTQTRQKKQHRRRNRRKSTRKYKK
jgi:hypothetical protein